MSVRLDPEAQLGFHRPLTQLVKRTLTVSNDNSHAVAFKIKTTAPRSYCVRPNSGRIEAGERVEVQVLLQPMKEDPPPGSKCRDKFLVQSASITGERESLALAELWTLVEKEDKAGIVEQKIRCAYLPPVDTNGAESTAPSAAAAAAATNGSHTPPRDEDDSKFDTVRSAAGADASPAVYQSAIQQPVQANGIDHSKPDVPPVAPLAPSLPAAATAFGAAAAGVAAAAAVAAGVPETKIKAVAPESVSKALTPASNTDNLATLRNKLAAAEAEIARLRANSGSDGLRQRSTKAGAASDRSAPGASVAHPASGGIPFQVVGGLMLASFLLGVILW